MLSPITVKLFRTKSQEMPGEAQQVRQKGGDSRPKVIPDDEEESHESKLLKAMYSWVMVLLGVSALVLVQLPFFQDVHKRSGTFVEELAFALILAGLFSLTVEKYHREEFRRFVFLERIRLKRDVFLYAYGHAIPEDTRQEIKDRILECPFHREQLRLNWYFSRAKAPDRVKLTKVISYVQRNGTKSPQQYHYRLHQNTTRSLLKQILEEQTQQVKIRRRLKKDILLEKSLQDGLKNEGELETNDIGELEPGEELEVSMTISEIRLMASDDSYSSKHPVVGLTTVSVHVEDGLNLTASAYCKTQPLQERTEHDPDRGLHAWQLREGILPFQGIMISWSPDLPKQSPAAEAGAIATHAEMKAADPRQTPVPPPNGIDRGTDKGDAPASIVETDNKLKGNDELGKEASVPPRS